jgi:hypothetical protein
MTTYTGSWLTKPRLGRQDTLEIAVGKVTWSGAPLANNNTLIIPDLIPFGEKMIVDSLTLYGTIPDTNATQTSALKIGVTGNDDAFLAPTVINQRMQLRIMGTGNSIGGAALTGKKDLIITMTANAATGVNSGSFWVQVLYRQRN